MDEEKKSDESLEKKFIGTLTETAQIHPMFRTQSEEDELGFVFDKEKVQNTENVLNG